MDSRIEVARDAAIAVIKPSARDLDYGRALHRDSLIIDAYGFGTHAPPRTERLNALIENGANSAELEDFRTAEALTRWAIEPNLGQEAMEAWDASGVHCVFVNAGEESNDVTTILKRLAHRTYCGELMRPALTCASNPADIEAARHEGRHCYYRVTNGVPLPRACQSVPEELSLVRVFSQLGARMMHLTYNRANTIGAGCAETHDAGLTDFGQAVIAEMNRVGVIPDVAHSGQRTSLEAARCSSRPIVASHTTCAALAEHIRAKGDDVLRAIADSGGVIGIVMFQAFLKGSYDLAAVLDHVDHVAKTIGIDHVAIGSDTPHMVRAPASDPPALRSPQQRQPWRAFWPADAFTLPAGLPPEAASSLSWTNFPFITVGLVSRGFTDNDIRKIMGGNILRVARQTWEQRDA